MNIRCSPKEKKVVSDDGAASTGRDKKNLNVFNISKTGLLFIYRHLVLSTEMPNDKI